MDKNGSIFEKSRAMRDAYSARQANWDKLVEGLKITLFYFPNSRICSILF